MFGKIIKHMERTGIVRKGLKKSAPKPVKYKLEGSNNVTLATEFQQPIQIKESPSQTQLPVTSALPQSRAAARRNLSLLQRKSLDSPEYEKPDDDLVSFERKDKPTDYESEVAEMSTYLDTISDQQTMRKAIKRAENVKLFEGNLEAGQIAKAPEGGGNVVWGYGSTFNIKDVEAGGAPISSKTIEQGFEKNIKSATSSARSAFKHWRTKGIIRKDQKFENLRPKERSLLIDLGYQLSPKKLKVYEKLAAALSSGISPNKENVKKELDVTWKPPGEARKKDTRRNKIRRKAYTV
jgi:hypothetical protein